MFLGRQKPRESSSEGAERRSTALQIFWGFTQGHGTGSMLREEKSGIGRGIFDAHPACAADWYGADPGRHAVEFEFGMAKRSRHRVDASSAVQIAGHSGQVLRLSKGTIIPDVMKVVWTAGTIDVPEEGSANDVQS